jgi:hypothetical protein
MAQGEGSTSGTTSIYLNATTDMLIDSMRRFPGPARPMPTPLHNVAHAVKKSVGRARNESKSTTANVLVN